MSDESEAPPKGGYPAGKVDPGPVPQPTPIHPLAAPAAKTGVAARRQPVIPPGVARPPVPAQSAKPEPFAFRQLADTDETLNVLYYGPGGSGKTTALAHMANLGQTLMINAEAGIKLRPLRKLGVKVENLRVFPDPGADQEISFASLERIFWQLKGDLQEDPKSWVGVIWDSLTEIHKKLLESVVTDSFARDLRKGNPKDRQPFFVELADYGTMTEQMRLLVRRYRDLPCHFGLSALERREQDDDSKVTYQPAVTPALQNDVFGYMDVVIHTTMAEVGEDEEYRGTTRPAGKYRGKDRFHELPKRMFSPTFDRCLSYIHGDLTWDTDPEVETARLRQPAE